MKRRYMRQCMNNFFTYVLHIMFRFLAEDTEILQCFWCFCFVDYIDVSSCYITHSQCSQIRVAYNYQYCRQISS